MQIFRRSDASPLAEWWRTVDKGLIAAILMLLAAGLVLSLAAGPAAANRLGYDDPFYFVYRQAAFAIADVEGEQESDPAREGFRARRFPRGHAAPGVVVVEMARGGPGIDDFADHPCQR